MRVLVTGATGFLGKAVVSALLDRGHTVRVLVRPSARLDRLEWVSKVEVARGDLRGGADLAPALEGVDAVAHVAAQVLGDPMAQFQGTVLGTERLLSALPGSGVRRLLLLSSLSVYDWRAPRGRLDEDSVLEQAPYERDGYAVAKLWQERLCREYAEKESLDLVVLRPGFIWGSTREWIDGVGIQAGPLVLVNGPFRRLPLTHVDNCADAVAEALGSEAAAGGTFNVFDSDETRAWRYGSEFARRSGLAGWLPFPYHAGLLLAYLASGVARLLLGPRYRLPGILLPQRYRARFRSLRFPNARLRGLGWSPPHDFGSCLERTFQPPGKGTDESASG
ncbi:MAG: NAD(P)-dependent oxidoreductase [Myxococcota bacterium]|nr:NAD(P)-dependent oxidoreductase [Myxococcota bacterium]